MRLSMLMSALTATLAIASPVVKRATIDDTAILNYALTLEYLERAFYRGVLAAFTQADFVAAGFADPFYANLKEIAYDEETHVSFLATALGTSGVHEASYSFPYTTPAGFVALSSVLEGVGVSAYLGAAASILDKTYLTIAGSILTVEARHSSYIRAALKESPFPKPFDTPLDFNQVFSLAAEFITAFSPLDGALPFTAFPPLTVATSQYQFTAGSSSVTFTDGYKNALALGSVTATTPVFAVLFSGLDTYYVPVKITHDDYKFEHIPAGINGGLPPTGQVYVVLSTSGTAVSDENTISGVGILEVNPVGQRTAGF